MGAGQSLGTRFLKVNHAGEQGAICIYSGQIFMARLTAPDLTPTLAEFKSHEQSHRATFWAELQRRGERRCRSYWLCSLGGFVLGLVTGLLGRNATMVTTVAIERVVLSHLEHQVEALQGMDTHAIAAISSIVADEKSHHDKSAANVQRSGLGLKMLSSMVSSSTEWVIWVGMRV
ncbi:MAG: demethoxyubiquinone hydroxylase family protein [Ideonella sp. MAG2]|nr:MAG: demethoxyubiquinone hydroxylase family protein [Ideonella sp. MAG2]